MTSTLVTMRLRALTMLMTLALLLQGGGVLLAVHWAQADAEPACVETSSHHHDDRAPGRAPSHHHHDHCAVCLAIAGIRPVSLVLPTMTLAESLCDQVVVDRWETPHFEVYDRHSGRGPPAHV